MGDAGSVACSPCGWSLLLGISFSHLRMYTFASRILCVLFKYVEHVNSLSVCIQVMWWSGAPEFMREKLREQELEEERMQRRHNLEVQRMRQRFNEEILSGWKQNRKAPDQEAATELGMSKSPYTTWLLSQF